MGRISEALYRALPLALTAMLWLTPSWGWAGTKRIAVAVGHNTGAGDQPPLRFAQDDAAKLADVLVELGGVDAADMFLVQGQGAAAVRGALDRARAAITRARAVPDDRVVLTFYYSGHSDGKAIELGKERITYAELRAWLSTTGADVRIAIIDSCKSGALVRPKGANRGPAFDVSMVNELSATGEVILTSAAADEDALESAEIRGSFFTHHLVSGLHGAADASGDGVVTLSEAYGYAFDRTVTSTAAAGAVPQHPTYDYRVAGRGDLPLTELTRRSAVLEMPAGFQRALIIQPRRDQVVAELGAGSTRRLAVAPGEYGVRLWRNGKQSAGRAKVGAGQTVTITWEQLTSTGAPPVEGRKGGRTEEPTTVEPTYTPAQQATWDTLWLSADDANRIYVGKQQRQLAPRKAFALMKRDDLIAKWDERQAENRWLIGGGVGLVVGAIVINRLVLNDCADQILDNRNGSCVNNASTVNTMAGIAVVTGITLSIVGLVRSSEVIGGKELQTAVEQHNQVVRERVRQLPGATAASRRNVTPRPRLHLSGWAQAGQHPTGGLVLLGTF